MLGCWNTISVAWGASCWVLLERSPVSVLNSVIGTSSQHHIGGLVWCSQKEMNDMTSILTHLQHYVPCKATEKQFQHFFHIPKTRGKMAKQREFPYPVGRETNTSIPVTNDDTASSCSGLRQESRLYNELLSVAQCSWQSCSTSSHYYWCAFRSSDTAIYFVKIVFWIILDHHTSSRLSCR